MPTLEELAKQRGANVAFTPQKKIFSGGFFSDVLDAISVPFYGTAGVIDSLSKNTSLTKEVASAIKTRRTVSSSLGFEDPWASFAIDVLTDPLTYVGFGAVTKTGAAAKGAGELAATIGGQARAGQRALVTVMGNPVIKGERALEGVTLVQEGLKQSFPAYSKFIERFGGRRALESVAGKLNIFDVEQAAAQFDRAIDFEKSVKRAEQVLVSTLNSTIDAANNALRAYSKKSGEDLTELSSKLSAKLYDPGVAIPSALDDVFKKMKSTSDEMGFRYNLAKDGSGTLEGYILPTVAKNNADVLAAGYKIRELGGKSTNELFREYTGMANAAGDVFGARTAKTSAELALKFGDEAAELVNSIKLTKVGDVYIPAEALKLIKKGEIVSKEAAETIKAEIDALKASKSRIDADLAKLEKSSQNASKEQISGIKKDVKLNSFASKRLDKEIKKMEKVLASSSKEAEKDMVQAFIDSNPDKVFRRVDVSLDDRNRLFKHFSGTEIETNPFRLMSVRARAVGKASSRKSFVDGMKGMEFAKKVGRGPLPDGYSYSTHAELKGYAFPTEITKHMDRTYTNFKSYEEIGTFLKEYDKAQGLLKGTLTYVSVAFHTRNLISNMWQMNYAMPFHKIFSGTAGAFELQNKVYRGFKAGDYAANLSKAEKKLVDEMLQEGLINTGSFTADMEGLMSKLNNNALYNAGRAVGASVEDMSKIALYKYLKDTKGFTKEAAGMEVRKLLFDYSDLTAFERNWLKRAFPFYTWSRKNIPLQLAMLVQMPGKFTRIGHFRDSVEKWTKGERPMDEEYLPAWLREAMPIYFGTGKDGMQKFIKLEGFIPAVDLSLLGRPKEAVAEMFTPLIKTPAELVMNYDIFKEREIKQFKGEKTRFLGNYISPEAEKLLSTIRPLNEINKLAGLNEITEIPPFKDRLMNFVIGKSYDYNLSQQKKVFDYIRSSQEGAIKKDIKLAQSKGEFKEVRRLQKLLQATQRGEGISL